VSGEANITGIILCASAPADSRADASTDIDSFRANAAMSQPGRGERILACAVQSWERTRPAIGIVCSKIALSEKTPLCVKISLCQKEIKGRVKNNSRYAKYNFRNTGKQTNHNYPGISHCRHRPRWAGAGRNRSDFRGGGSFQCEFSLYPQQAEAAKRDVEGELYRLA